MPYWSILLLDSVLVVFAGLLAYTLHHGSIETGETIRHLALTLAVFLCCYFVGFRSFHTYEGVIRFSSFSDLRKITLAVLVSTALVVIVEWIFAGATWLVPFSASDIILFALFAVCFLWTVRVWVKTLYENFIKDGHKEGAFILGIKSGGVALAKNINSSEDSPYKVAGFVTAEADMEHRRLMNVKVYPFGSHLVDDMRRRKANTLIISPLLMDFIRDNSKTIDELADNGIKIMVIPQAKEWDGKSNLRASDLRPVNVEDLLPREKIEVDMKAAADLINGNVVMITGAAGSIGSEIVRQVATYGPGRLILIDQAETPMHASA